MSIREYHGDLKKAIKAGIMFQNMAEDCLFKAEDPFLFDCIDALTVNAAFACEVFIKAICIYEQEKFYKGHDLQDNYSMLSKTTQERIKKEFESKMENTSFDEALSINRKAFEDWRYSFQDNKDITVDIYALITMMRCLRNYIETIRPAGMPTY